MFMGKESRERVNSSSDNRGYESNPRPVNGVPDPSDKFLQPGDRLGSNHGRQ